MFGHLEIQRTSRCECRLWTRPVIYTHRLWTLCTLFYGSLVYSVLIPVGINCGQLTSFAHDLWTLCIRILYGSAVDTVCTLYESAVDIVYFLYGYAVDTVRTLYGYGVDTVYFLYG